MSSQASHPADVDPTESATIESSNLRKIRLFLEAALDAEELDERLELPGAQPSELAVAEALNAFLDKLWMQSFELGAKQDMLERTIEIRTNEVHEILNNVDTGFLLTLADETILDNYSRSCESIFQTQDIKGKKLSALLPLDEARTAVFSLSYEQAFDGFLPPEVSLVQLPREFIVGERTYALHGTPIMDKIGNLTKVFFTINDTTELRQAERDNVLRQALLDIIRQKDSFIAFLKESSQGFARLRNQPSQSHSRNFLHTLKGNLGCYGLCDIAELVHAIEEAPRLEQRHLVQVESTLQKFLAAHDAVLGIDYPEPNQSNRRVDLDQLQPGLLHVITQATLEDRQAALAQLLHQSTWIAADALFAPLRGVFERTVERLEKQARLEVRGADVLVDPERVASVFSNLGHLLRNSLDHGIEPAFERGNKPECGQVVMSCRDSFDAWNIEVADDGRGLDVEALCAAAISKGKLTAAQLTGLTWEQRARVLFLDGLSTRQEATMESGRGVGMSALLESVEHKDGSIELMSTPGRGTTVAICIPKVPPAVKTTHTRRPASIFEPLGTRADIRCSLIPASEKSDSFSVESR